jgi:phosphate transport system ATP-binding protein
MSEGTMTVTESRSPMVTAPEITAPAPPRRRPPSAGRQRPHRDARDSRSSTGRTRPSTDISLAIPEKSVTAFIGPSGCGKSTLPALPESHERHHPGHAHRGERCCSTGTTSTGSGTDVVDLRRRVGMVFQKSNPFPKSIFENVAYGLKINGLCRRAELPERVERALRASALWDEVKERMHTSALGLSAGSSSASASRGRSPSSRRSCSWTSPPRRSIRSRRRRSRS